MKGIKYTLDRRVTRENPIKHSGEDTRTMFPGKDFMIKCLPASSRKWSSRNDSDRTPIVDFQMKRGYISVSFLYEPMDGLPNSYKKCASNKL